MAKQEKQIKTAADLKQDAHNYRKHSETNKARIKKSIEEAGLGRSVVIDADGVLVAGNGVQSVIDGDTPVKVVETDGTELVVVKRTDLHTGDPRRKTLALADNATADDVEWDFDAIAEDWSQDEVGEWGVDWPNDEEAEQQEAQEDDFDETVDKVETVCKKGDIWKLGDHRLMCGDCTDAGDVALLMDGEKADLLITDPPYGVAIGDKNKMLNEKNGTHSIETNIANDNISTEALYQVLVKAMDNGKGNCKDDAAYYVFSPQCGELGLMMMMMMMKDAGLTVRHMLVWVKNSATFSMGRLDYDYRHEPIFYTWTKNHHFYGGYQNSVFEDELDVDKMKKDELVKLVKEMLSDKVPTSVIHENKPLKNDLHPTMKPVALIGRLMGNSSKYGDAVLDLFGGSGSTMIACEQLGRKCFMMELDPHYCDVIIARWEKLTGNKAEKVNVGS